jgi:NAD(P)H-flavin reductase/ferredoxin
MVVRTQTDALRKLRRNILGFMMLEHPNSCLVCGKRELCEEYRPTAEKAGRTTGCHTCNNKSGCDVRQLAADLELTELPEAPIYHQRPLERQAPFIDRDLNLCILCGRCVRVCKEQQGAGVIDFIGRGSAAHIGQAFDQTLLEAGCTLCGSCVDVCPTGSLSDRHAKWYGEPDTRTVTTCAFCPEACPLIVAALDGQAISTRSANPSMPLCVLGRFSVAEFANGQHRLETPLVRVGTVLRQTQWKQALEQAAARFALFQGDAFALACDTTATLEDRHAFRRFTADIMKSPHYIELTPDSRGWTNPAKLPQGVRAVITTGALVTTEQAAELEALAVIDCFPTPLSERADFVLPATVFTEMDGTIADMNGVARPLRAASPPRGAALPAWQIVTELSRALGAEGLPYENAAAITDELGLKKAVFYVNRAEAPAPARNPSLRRAFHRNHRIEEQVSGLLELPPLDDCSLPAPSQDRQAAADAFNTPSPTPTPPDGRFKIVSLSEIVPNTFEIVITAPEVARKALAGQFCIVMADALSERVPYTLSDWDAEKGTITLVVLEKGQSSRKLTLLRPGDCVAHVTGPLGIPLDILRYGNVVLTGGCYGIGAIVPIARAMRAAGNHVTVVTEARSWYLAYYREKLAGIADECIPSTIDGSLGEKGHSMDVVGQRLEAGKRIDLVIAIGCPFMMMLTARETEPYGVKTLAALNPIMLDGTGMCGACRISVGGETKFACVDGPFFDAHKVDWDEVRDRRTAYAAAEIQSVGRSASVATVPHNHHGNCGCVTDALNV